MKRLGLALLSLSLISCAPSEKKESPSWEGPGQRTGESKADFRRRCQSGDGNGNAGVPLRDGTLCLVNLKTVSLAEKYEKFSETIALSTAVKGSYVRGYIDEGPNDAVAVYSNSTRLGTQQIRQQQWYYVPEEGPVSLVVLAGNYKGGVFSSAFCYGLNNDYEACPNPLPQ